MRFGGRTDPYTVVDASVTSGPLIHGLSVQLSVKNVLDQAYAMPGGDQHVQQSLPQRGRVIYVRLGWGW